MNIYHFTSRLAPRKLESVRFHVGYEHPTPLMPVSVHVAGIGRWVGEASVERARGETFVIEQITAGDAVFVQDKKEYRLGPGDVYLLRLGGHHIYKTGPSGWLHKRFVSLHGPLLMSTLRTLGLADRDVVRPENPGTITAIMRRIYRLMDKSDPLWTEKVSIAGYELLVTLSRNLPLPYPPSLNAALSHIERNLHRRITEREICEHADLSVPHLCRLFRQHVGMPPMKYVTSMRAEWAKRLLRSYTMSIKEIANTVGYDDQLYFSAQFKRTAGMSPKEYRRTTQGGAAKARQR